MRADGHRDSWHLRLIPHSRQFLVESLLDDLQLEALYDPLFKNLRGEKSDRAVTPPSQECRRHFHREPVEPVPVAV
jgi:hypothetical protein